MKIKMIQTRRMSHDGFDVRPYRAGQEYDLPEICARYALNNGWAYNAEPFPVEGV